MSPSGSQQHCCGNREPGDAVQVAFDSLGSLPMQKIRDVREVKQALVDGEMQKRENREKMRRSLSISSAPNTKASPVNGTDPLPLCLLQSPEFLVEGCCATSLRCVMAYEGQVRES